MVVLSGNGAVWFKSKSVGKAGNCIDQNLDVERSRGDPDSKSTSAQPRCHSVGDVPTFSRESAHKHHLTRDAAFFMKLVELSLAVFGALCWPICFVWMHRISCRQEEMLRDLNEQTRRIENLSRAEHELIKEVHPQVEEIKDGVKELAKR